MLGIYHVVYKPLVVWLLLRFAHVFSLAHACTLPVCRYIFSLAHACTLSLSVDKGHVAR